MTAVFRKYGGGGEEGTHWKKGARNYFSTRNQKKTNTPITDAYTDRPNNKREGLVITGKRLYDIAIHRRDPNRSATWVNVKRRTVSGEHKTVRQSWFSKVGGKPQSNDHRYYPQQDLGLPAEQRRYRRRRLISIVG